MFSFFVYKADLLQRFIAGVCLAFNVINKGFAPVHQNLIRCKEKKNFSKHWQNTNAFYTILALHQTLVELLFGECRFVGDAAAIIVDCC